MNEAYFGDGSVLLIWNSKREFIFLLSSSSITFLHCEKQLSLEAAEKEIKAMSRIAFKPSLSGKLFQNIPIYIFVVVV